MNIDDSFLANCGKKQQNIRKYVLKKIEKEFSIQENKFFFFCFRLTDKRKKERKKPNIG